MAGIIDEFELAGLREDFDNMLGIYNNNATEVDAKTIVSIIRVLDRGPLNPTTQKYDSPVTEAIYTGAGHFSPVTYRRDRQEIGGGEAVRIRQYRAVVPWDAGDIHIDDVLQVVDCSDPNVIGRFFDVTDVLYESELAARRISLVDTSKDTTGLC